MQEEKKVQEEVVIEPQPVPAEPEMSAEEMKAAAEKLDEKADKMEDAAEAKAAAEAEVERSPREILYERIRAARPDGKYDEDEMEWSRSAMSMLDENDKKAKGYDSMTEKILKRFNADPEEAAAWLDYLDGMSMREAIVKNMGEEAWAQPTENSEGFEAYAKTRDARRKQMDDNAALIAELQDNDAKSLEAINNYIEENKLNEEEAAKFKELIAGIYNKMQRNIVDKDMLQGFMRYRNYDKDLEAAREQGKIDARNEKIEAKKKEMAGSGLPNANAGGEATTDVEKEPANPTAAWLNKFNHK